MTPTAIYKNQIMEKTQFHLVSNNLNLRPSSVSIKNKVVNVQKKSTQGGSIQSQRTKLVARDRSGEKSHRKTTVKSPRCDNENISGGNSK